MYAVLLDWNMDEITHTRRPIEPDAIKTAKGGDILAEIQIPSLNVMAVALVGDDGQRLMWHDIRESGGPWPAVGDVARLVFPSIDGERVRETFLTVVVPART